MLDKNILYDFINYIPYGKVVSYKKLADIFCSSPIVIAKMLWEMNNIDLSSTYEIVESEGYIRKLDTKTLNLNDEGTKTYNNQIYKQHFREPTITNYYVSLITSDPYAIEQFETISHKIKLLHPNHIIKTPTNYHITLADLSNTQINKELIKDIFWEINWLSPFVFQCTLHKPHIDTKKNKVIFWIRLNNNPFLITLHSCIKKHIPRRSEKIFLPHITLGKILGTTKYNGKILEYSLKTDCIIDRICITANIDQKKDVVLFERKIY